MKLLFEYLKPFRSTAILLLIFALISQLFSIGGVFIFQILIDDYITPTGLSFETLFWGIGVLALAQVVIAAISRVGSAFEAFYTSAITEKLGTNMYIDGIKKSMNMPYSEFENQMSGQTLGIIEKVRDDVKKLIKQFVTVIYAALIGLVVAVGYSFVIHWSVVLIFAVSAPIVVLISNGIGKKIKAVQKSIVNETGDLAGNTTERLRNIEIVKSLGLTNQENDRLERSTDKILQLELQKIRKIRLISFWQGTTVQFLTTLLIVVLSYLVINEDITLGQFFTARVFTFYVFQPLYGLGDTLNSYRETEASLEKFAKILESPVEIVPDDAEGFDSLEQLEFKNVHFQHQTASTPAVDGISFCVKKGESAAFVGPSGAGKTTLVKLLIGLYQPNNGTISYNKIPHTKLEINSLREGLGYVTQENYLFSGSIRDNLKFVNPDATDEEVIQALKDSAAWGVVERGGEGLDTLIGENGIKLSGGEKQRLSIARALLRKPSLLIFDEATSSLDSITEEDITQTIKEVSKDDDKITIQIAHRLSTIMHVDKIFVLEKGKVVEQGKHDDLLKEKGLYYAMWRQQTGERI